MTAGRSVTATAQGKVNLHLAVGDAREDGYHELRTVFQALDLTETVTLTVVGVHEGVPADLLDLVASVSVTGRDAAKVPTGEALGDNLAVRGVLSVLEHYRDELAGVPSATFPVLDILVDKGVPVAGGMAGGSADAAAAMMATREILHGDGAAESGFDRAPRPGDETLSALAATLGADVPFCLAGGTALGHGRGDVVVPVLTRGTYHWALAMDPRGLSTAEVFARLDEQRDAAARGDRPDLRAGGPEEAQRAILAGDVDALAAHLDGTTVNDLQAPAISLSPDLRRTLAAGKDAGALACLVSGSGPTVAMLCRDRDHAVDVATALSSEGVGGRAVPTTTAASSRHGARIVSPA
ncbi:4-(cytidine 5'-diphospho)-2-C-methyl-D-erythritol kinase [Corynebacterium sp. USCH3]|uniref:4-(cytidine 5'-diphospho)-2-C-methyl-D-erythritol kinase n=1 Tax=Corynebacterium sp. USCH3 TaxID=3024840 RepID=UPI0030B5D658